MAIVSTKIKKAKANPILRRWHFVFEFQPSWGRTHAYRFEFGFFKFTSWPAQGDAFQKENYKGFWIRWDLNFDFLTYEFSHNFMKKEEKICTDCGYPIQGCCYDLNHTHLVCECPPKK